MKAENLQNDERMMSVWAYEERMMVRWMCGVSLKDRKQSEVFFSFLGVQSVADRVLQQFPFAFLNSRIDFPGIPVSV